VKFANILFIREVNNIYI